MSSKEYTKSDNRSFFRIQVWSVISLVNINIYKSGFGTLRMNNLMSVMKYFKKYNLMKVKLKTLIF